VCFGEQTVKCPKCSDPIALAQLINPFGAIRCTHCNEKLKRVATVPRTVVTFATIWGLVAAIHFGRERLVGSLLLPLLLLAFISLNFVIVISTPLSLSQGDSNRRDFYRFLLPVALSLFTLFGLRWIRGL
jgi:DNA-directed RNA polymerase subunit RPC12/RpoP